MTGPGHDTDMNDIGRQVTETERWLDRFRERNGRSPTVLHIGNIANAAYLNARMLNEAGIDCDVLCYEYYHIMGCPEWESAVFDPNGVDPDRPLWSRIDLHAFERPRWFAQGALGSCIDYLIADRIVVPLAEQPFYTEKIVHLPDAYPGNARLGQPVQQGCPYRGD